MVFEKLLEDYKKQGFEVQGRRTTKLTKWAFLTKKREGLLAFGHNGVYLYFVEGDVKLEHMNDFLKRYAKIHDERNFDDRDYSLLAYTGKLNTREFRTLAKNVLSEDQYSGMKLKKIKPIITKKVSVKRVKKKRVEKEEIIKREIMIEAVKEAEITVGSIKREINKWKNVAPKVSGKGKEKKMTLSMTGYLSGKFPEISLEEKLGRSRIDATIGKIGIEAKYRPDQNEINRLFGQVDSYLRYLDHIIVVFFDTKQAIINEFMRKIRTGGYNKNVTIMSI